MLVTEFQEILKKVNPKFIKRIDILNNYVDLYNDETKKAVQVPICGSVDIFEDVIFEGVRQIDNKILIGKDTQDILNVFYKHWNDEKITFITKKVGLDWFIELRDFDVDFVMGSYILTEQEALRINKRFENTKKPTLKQLLNIIK